MHLKKKKTAWKIVEAFYALRDKYLPEKMKVKDICEMANINKTTFYNHYTDILELSDEIDEESVNRIIDLFPQKDHLLEAPQDYIEGLATAIEGEFDNIKIVFGDRVDVLCEKLENGLKKYYENAKQPAEKQMTVSFIIGGAIGVLRDGFFASKEKFFQKKRFAEYTAKIVLAVTALFYS